MKSLGSQLALSILLLPRLLAGADGASTAPTQPVILEDGGKTFSIASDPAWRVRNPGGDRVRGIVIGLRKYKTDDAPSRTFIVQEDAGALDLENEAKHILREADDSKQAKVSACTIDGETGKEIDANVTSDGNAVRQVDYVLNHNGRFYHIRWICLPLDGKDGDLAELLKTFKWHDSK